MLIKMTNCIAERKFVHGGLSYNVPGDDHRLRVFTVQLKRKQQL